MLAFEIHDTVKIVKTKTYIDGRIGKIVGTSSIDAVMGDAFYIVLFDSPIYTNKPDIAFSITQYCLEKVDKLTEICYNESVQKTVSC